MDTTPPNITEAPHVHGMQSRDLPGFYNTSCDPLISTSCISQLNLVCVDKRCLCIYNYIPDDSGGCKDDVVRLLVMWIVRLFVCVSIFVICLSVFHMLVTKRCCRETRGRRQGGEGEAEEGRRNSTNTCWYDEPPSYPEVAEEPPPPTYLEALAKERRCNREATREATERAAPPQPVPPRRERGVEAPITPPQPLPAPPYTAPPQSLHI